MFNPEISIIITTYNRPDALALVLNALTEQSLQNFEVIIADDGSSNETVNFINPLKAKLPYPLQQVWQEDIGFRAARSRNQAVKKAKASYLLFMDGDCIPRIDFVEKHHQLAQKGYFVAGNRVLLSEKFTQQLIRNYKHGNTPSIWNWSNMHWFVALLSRKINRFSPLLRLPILWVEKFNQQKWQGAKTCNLAIWRKDFIAINGFNEDFQGWGHEDAELVVRLLANGVIRKEGRFAVPVLHLWHFEAPRDNEKQNHQLLEKMLENTTIVAINGLNTPK